MNVRPLHYGWREFYDHAVDLTRYALSGARVRRRFWANRGISERGRLIPCAQPRSNRAAYQAKIRQLLDSDIEGAPLYRRRAPTAKILQRPHSRKSLGPLWDASARGCADGR